MLRAVAKALAHPVRAKLLIALSEKGEGGASIREVAERVGEGKRTVRYHLDAMLGTGLVEIAAEKRKRGVVERFFRARQAPEIANDSFASIGDDLRRQIAIEILKAVFTDVTGAARAGKLYARPDISLSRVPSQVDECGWQELAGIHESCLREVQAVLCKSRQRMQASGETPIHAISVHLLFEVPPWPST